MDIKSLKIKISAAFIIIFSGVLIAAYFAYLSGSSFFMLETGKDSVFAVWVVSGLLFYADLVALIYGGLECSFKRSAVYGVIYIPVWFVCSWIGIGLLIGTVVLPIIYILCLGTIDAIKRDSGKPGAPKSITPLKQIGTVFIKLLSVSIIMTFYNILSYYIKADLLLIDASKQLSLISKVFYQLDYIIFLLFLSVLIKGGFKNALAVLESVFCTKNRSCDKLGGGDYEQNFSKAEIEALDRIDSSPPAYRLVLLGIVTLVQVGQTFIILAVCNLGSVFFEGVCVIISFWIARSIINKCWHSDSVLLCTLISTILFYSAAKLSLPLNLSMYMPFVMGIAVSALLAYVELKTNNQTKSRG